MWDVWHLCAPCVPKPAEYTVKLPRPSHCTCSHLSKHFRASSAADDIDLDDLAREIGKRITRHQKVEKMIMIVKAPGSQVVSQQTEFLRRTSNWWYRESRRPEVRERLPRLLARNSWLTRTRLEGGNATGDTTKASGDTFRQRNGATNC